MQVKVTITGPTGQNVEHEAEVRQPGELERIIHEAMDLYRTLFPDAPPFDKTIRVEHA